MDNKRTISQNKAMHLYFTQIAEELRNIGLTMNDIVKAFKSVEIAPTPMNVKENIWKPIQIALFKKESTAKLTKKELNEVSENVAMFLSPMGISLPFPSMDTLMEEELYKQNI